jgi:glycosyltransferase involved in cell wall biosynthesis
LPSRPAILYVGHFDPLDDVWFFCKGVVSASVKHGATVVIVGDGPQLPEVKKFFAQKSEVQVHFTGTLAFEDYLRVLAACDVATFPYPNNAVYRAKCSARIVDFMAFGKAILSSAVGENLQYLVNGESGILVPPNDGPAYESALDSLLSDMELRDKIGQGARQRLVSHFIWERQAETCLKAYQRILNRPAATFSSVARA